ncbi:MAG: radical SAM protein [Candidatus Omnitrophica bacterium]|nr:radical SAM protein [Candidatus Omnitrophota bacterium]
MSKIISNLQYVPAKPMLLGRIFVNYLSQIVLRRPLLRVVNFAVNYACQLSCQHCSAEGIKDQNEGQGKLTLDEIKKFFKEAEQCGTINYHFTGGEPLLEKRFYDIVLLIRKDRNILSMVTNGLLLAEEAGRLKDAGFDLIQVSIDSPDPDVHDKIRGYPGAHQKSWEGVEAALDQKLKVMLCMVATNENLENGEVEKQIEICRKKGIVLQILPARNVGKWEGESSALLSEENKTKFYRLVQGFYARWDGQSSYFPPCCLAGRERLYISPTGDVYPCDFIQESYGNVREESLKKIWERILSTHPYQQKNRECLTAFNEEFIRRPKQS